MPRINKVGHVVLNVEDVAACVKFYHEALGMEVMRFDEESQMAFLSFGTQHHDIALFPLAPGLERSERGLNHIAMQIEGGKEELRKLYGRLLTAGARIEGLSDHIETLSIYFFDPDGNGLEIFCEMMTPQEGMEHIRGADVMKPLELEPIFTS